MQGVLIPPDVEHNNEVPIDGAGPQLIEFQSTRRLDFPPERQQIVLPAAPTAQPVPQGRHVPFDFSAGSSGWNTVAKDVRTKQATGSTTAVSSWEFLAAAEGPVQLRSFLHGAEQFVYVAEGTVEAIAGGSRFAIAPGGLPVNASNGPPLRVGRQGNQRALVVVCEARR
jgi:hypothetical protein